MGNSNTSDVSRRRDVGTLGRLATAQMDGISEGQKGAGALAKTFVPQNKTGYGGYQSQGVIDIVNEYPWTLTNVKGRKDIPKIELREYRMLEGVLKQQVDFYSRETVEKFKDAETGEVLSIYDEIWPKNAITKSPWNYIFPYFSDVAFSLTTPSWQRLDDIGPAIKGVADQIAGAAGDIGAKGLEKGIKRMAGVLDFSQQAANVALKYKYPNVGATDRPKIFTSHTERTTKIEFPLYNTINQYDWAKNRDFIYLFMSQNLFNKRDYITGVPPVWYEVEIPGQYFCVAACVTDFNVTNLGNIRMIGGENAANKGAFNIPDAYQVSITLQEMTMPSKNQFEHIIAT